VEQAIIGGCTIIQLREKQASAREFYDISQSIRKITERYRVPLIVNDRLDVALAIDAEGAHIGQEDLPVPIARRMMGNRKLLGVSVCTWEQAACAEAEGADYLGVGAMFATDTKTDAGLVSMEELGRIRRAVSIPVVVIGGIDRQTAGRFAGSGIDGFAVVSGIISHPNISGAARELSALFREIRKG
jgi:thiamine-phosphate pyrophosphorylase